MSTLLSRLYNFVTDKSNSVKITASRVDGELNQLVTAVNRKMLCAATAPADPINGQTWVDTTNNLVKCYLNNAWVIIANYIYIQTAEPEGMAEGYLWYDTANNLLKAYNGATWDNVNISDMTSFPASTAAGDILYLSGAKAFTRLAKGTTAQYLKGGDSPSWATFPPGLGDWDGGSYSDDTSYLAATDGFVCAFGQHTTSMLGYTDASNPPTTQRCANWATSGVDCGITMPVKKGQYWKVAGADHINWIPLGA